VSGRRFPARSSLGLSPLPDSEGTFSIEPLVAGVASGRLIVLTEPLSLWGGLDPASGVIIDIHHPQQGVRVGGCILLMPGGRGSSSSSSVLVEAVRQGTNPSAMLLLREDPILIVGAIVARMLYRTTVPVALVHSSILNHASTGDFVRIERSSIMVHRQ
jgi:uncharacterized protein